MDFAVNRLGATASTDRLMRCLALWAQWDETYMLFQGGTGAGRILGVDGLPEKTRLVRDYLAVKYVLG